MNTTSLSPRRSDESDRAWHIRARRYVRKNAPDEQRRYINGGKLGAKNQRWILVIIFLAIGLFIGGVSFFYVGGDARKLNGANSAVGDFIVQDIQKETQYSSSQGANYVPVVTIRNQSVIPMMSHGHQFEKGSTVRLRYTVTGKALAGFTDAKGYVSMGGAIAGVIIGSIFALIGILLAVFYRGVTDSAYVDRETARLIGKP